MVRSQNGAFIADCGGEFQPMKRVPVCETSARSEWAQGVAAD
jgi:hypothetical protein